jgi:hypothetical protein
MTAIAITGMGLTGVLRMTWVQDHLAHVLDHSLADETSGTWTGLACPGYGLALGADVDNATRRRLTAGGEIADLIWEASTSSPLTTPRCSRPRSAPITPPTPNAPMSFGRTSGPSGRRPGRPTTRCWSSCRARA